MAHSCGLLIERTWGNKTHELELIERKELACKPKSRRRRARGLVQLLAITHRRLPMASIYHRCVAEAA